MKLFLIRISSLIVTIAMLMLFAPAGANTDPYDVKDPETCLMNLTVFSDVHVESNNYPRYKVFANSMRNVKHCQSGSDAILFLGDNVMNGQNIENMIFHGTHDFGNGDGDFNKIQNRWYDYTRAYFGRKLKTPYFYDDVNGFRFIVLANEQQNIDEMHMSDEQYAWLEQMLEEAAQTEKPVFILAHYPPRMASSINPDSQYDLCRMLADYNRVNDLFYLCGHLHRSPDATTFHSWSGFPESYLPCLTLLSQDDNRDITDESGFGQQVEVYPDRVVFRVRNYYTGEWGELNGAPHEATYMLKNPIG